MIFHGYEVKCMKRGNGKATRYDLVVASTGEPFASINLPSLNHSETVIAIKNYSENEGMLEFLQENGIIKDVVGIDRSGFVSVPIVKIDQKRLLA